MAIRNDYEIANKTALRELYHFYIGDGSWFDYKYTNRDTDYTDAHYGNGGYVYKASNIRRNKIKQSTAAITNTVELTTSKNNPVAKAFIGVPPYGGINIDMAVAYDEDAGAITDPENLTYWKGTVIDVKFDGNTAVLICDSKFKVLDRLALRRRATMHCPYALFSEQCGVGRAGSGRSGVVTGISTSVTFTVLETPGTSTYFGGRLDSLYDFTKHYLGGYVHYADPTSNYESKVGIKSFTADSAGTGADEFNITVTTEIPITDLIVGATIALYPGCARNVKHCYNKFGNYVNFGGIVYLTTDEPFDSSFRTPLN